MAIQIIGICLALLAVYGLVRCCEEFMHEWKQARRHGPPRQR